MGPGATPPGARQAVTPRGRENQAGPGRTREEGLSDALGPITQCWDQALRTQFES